MKRLIRTLLVSVLVVGLISAASRTSLAEEEDQAQRDAAEKFFRAGEQAYKAGQYMMAAQAFEQALKRYAVPAIVFSTAQAYRLQYFIDKDAGWLKRSIELYERYVKEVEKGGRRDDAVASLAELQPIMLRIEAEKRGPIITKVIQPTTQLLINTQVAGARASIDGHEGVIPFSREVKAGPHKVRVWADGYFAEEQTQPAVEGQTAIVEVELRPMPALVTLKTESGAQVSVDGRPIGAAPFARPLNLPAGKHYITVTSRGRRAFSTEIHVKRGQKVELRAPLRATTQRRVSKWVLIGSGVVFLAAGATGIGALGADSDASDLKNKRDTEGLTVDELAEYESKRTDRDDRRRDTFILAGIGTTIAAAGLIMMLFDNPQAEALPFNFGGSTKLPEAGSVSFSPVVAPDRAGVAFTGWF